MWSRPATGLSSKQASRPASRQPVAGQAQPWTAQSRPSTARPQTSVSARHEGSFVIALLEGRGAGREVGLAALDKDTGRVALVQVCSTDVMRLRKISTILQLSDCQTYVKTLHQIHLHRPSLILVPDTFLSASDAAFATIGSTGKGTTSSSLLVEFIQEEFPDTPLEPIPRKYWNETSGLFLLDFLSHTGPRPNCANRPRIYSATLRRRR